MLGALTLGIALATPGSAQGIGPGPHALHRDLFGPQAAPPRLPAPGVMSAPTPGPTARVYGYLPYWASDLSTVPWDDLTDVAMFSAGVTPTGQLTDTGRWSQAANAVAMGAPYGVRVHLCVTNFNSGELETLLGSASARATLIANLQTWVATTGAHGVNIDFEGLPVSRKAQMVAFAAELDAAFDDVVLATPAVDWGGAWDFDELTLHADLFIMGYDYHWSGSAQSGPSDPLYSGSGTVWAGEHALDWTVADYLTWGANPDRVILGLPLYGRAYLTGSNAVPTASNGDGGTVLWSTARSELPAYNAQLEPGARSMFYHDGVAQHWVNDVETLRERIQFGLGAGLAGVGFWALNYDDEDPDLWAMVREETGGAPLPGDTDLPDPDPDPHPDPDPDPDPDPQPTDPDFVAVGGLPVLAYPGDTVVLTAEGSLGPAGVALTYTWTQRAGPPVELTSRDSMTPSFVVPTPGTYAFAVRVGDGQVSSPPALSWVAALDPAASDRVQRRACGCASPTAPGFGLGLLGLLALRRRAHRPGTQPATTRARSR